MMEQNDEDFNYDSQYKKLCTGLGSFLNSAQQNQSFSADGMTNNGFSSSSSTPYSSAELSKCKKFLFIFSGIGIYVKFRSYRLMIKTKNVTQCYLSFSV